MSAHAGNARVAGVAAPRLRGVRRRYRFRGSPPNVRTSRRAAQRARARRRQQSFADRMAGTGLYGRSGRGVAMATACSIRVRGVVQGVGFRPFVYRLARANTLAGWVFNGAEGVEIHLEGSEPSLDAFMRDLKLQAPPAASIAEIEIEPADAVGLRDFTIRTSKGREHPTVRISPDLAVCDACLEELFDPGNPRYNYPYINCTNCGPRYSVVLRLPYDRCN